MTPLLLRLLFVLLIAFSVSSATSLLVHAEDLTPPTVLENPLGKTSLSELVAGILQIVVKVGVIVVIFMLVYVGFKFVTARGEPGAITEAKTALMWTVVGALILLGAEAIAIGIQETVKALSEGT